jgi:A/G-specific adenine glycosylase
MAPATLRVFHRDLVRWYRRHHRKLPWRATRDPYKVWVSEIMLQQTRVDVVRDYYARWLDAFPTVESVAKAPFQRVLKLWEGLGYYTRAKNLHRAAKLVVGRARSPRSKQRRTAGPAPNRDSGPAVPAIAAELMKLPGIGRYTAGAIASIAFGQRVPLVDGNVARVFARIFNVAADVTKPSTQASLWALADKLLPSNDPGVFNQALMELGALVCTPVNPRCGVCPMNRACIARAKGRQDALPNRGARRTHKQVVHDAALVRRGNRILLRRRPAHGLLAGMWELPLLGKRFQRRRPRSNRGKPLLTLRHTVTNRKITLRVFACETLSEPKPNGSLRWASPKDLARLTLPAAHRRALERILSAQQ